MAGTTQVIGALLTAYVPDVDTALSLDYTHVRFYLASTEDGTYSLLGSEALASGTKSYSYNYTNAIATDWFRWALYGSTVGQGPLSEAVPVGPPQTTRKDIRQGVGARLKLMELVTATGVNSTSFTAPELIDPDRSVHTVGNRWARPVTGTYAGATRRVRAGAAGYTNKSTGTVAVARAWGGTLAASTPVEMWVARGDQDTSQAVDDAIDTCRMQLWWQDTWYFTTEAGVSDYYLPTLVLPGSIHSVDFAAETYPSKPNWRPVGWWDLVMDSGTPLLTVLASAVGHAPYSQGRVIRIIYNRFADHMDSDADAFGVPHEWAIAEASLEFLKAQLSPNGSKEDMAGALTAVAGLEAECKEFRARHMPAAPAPIARIAR